MGAKKDSGRDKSSGYRVGKWKPDPKFSWKPGQSGNPTGRPKGRKNLKTIVRASARRTITVTQGGRKRKLTVLEVGMLNLERDVAQGNRNAFRDYFTILERHLDQSETKLSMEELTAQDRALLDYVIARTKRRKTRE